MQNDGVSFDALTVAKKEGEPPVVYYFDISPFFSFKAPPKKYP